MKRFLLIVGAIAAVLVAVFLLWPHHGGDTGSPDTSKPATPATQAVTNSSNQLVAVASPEPGSRPTGVASNPFEKYPEEMEKELQRANQGHDTPVAFYGLVVDQDSNVLQNVTVDVAVKKLYTTPSLTVTGMTTRLQRQTGADGRFEVTGLKGNFLMVEALTKDGYEPELQRNYGMFGPQSTSFEKPAVLRLWSTNAHEPLITGEKSFVIIPDGRHYAIDLVKGTITEGDDGDLVAWVKRPESVKFGQRYDWSCEVTLPGGGLLESESRAMFIAPEAGYTNEFAYQEAKDVSGWGDLTGDKRFYVHLRNGQMHGRIDINLYAYYKNNQPGMIQLSYAINPSGSRLLR